MLVYFGLRKVELAGTRKRVHRIGPGRGCRLTGQPFSIGALACAQIGVPVAAATLGTQLNLLEPGEAPALILGALVTIAIASVAGGTIARHAAPEAEPAASTVTVLVAGTGAPIAKALCWPGTWP